MGERFAAEDADGRYVGVGGGDERVIDADRASSVFDSGEGRLHVRVWSFCLEEAEDLFRGVGVGRIWWQGSR